MADPCGDCGQCCVTMDRPPFNYWDEPDKSRWDALPAKLKEAIDADADDGIRPYGSPCLWYDTESKRCRHYDSRPEVCRTYIPGVRSCNDRRITLGLVALPHVDADDEDDDLPAEQEVKPNG